MESLNCINRRCTNPDQSRMYISSDKYHAKRIYSLHNANKYKRNLNFKVKNIDGSNSYVVPLGRAKGKVFSGVPLYNPIDNWGVFRMVENVDGVFTTKVDVSVFRNVMSTDGKGYPYEVCDNKENHIGNILDNDLHHMLESWNTSDLVLEMRPILNAYNDMAIAYINGLFNAESDKLRNSADNLFRIASDALPHISLLLRPQVSLALNTISVYIDKRIVQLQNDTDIIINTILCRLKKKYAFIGDNELLPYAKTQYELDNYRSSDRRLKRRARVFYSRYLRTLKQANYLRSRGMDWPLLPIPYGFIYALIMDSEATRARTGK